MVGRSLELGDPLGARRDGLCADRRHVRRRHVADLRPAVERGELDVEPPREPPLVRPDPGHLRSGVAGDHSGQSRARSWSARPQDPRRQHGGVACVVDADRRDGHAGRHLDDREQRVEPVEHATATSAAGRRSPAAPCAPRRRRAARRRARRRRSAPAGRALPPRAHTRRPRRASGVPSAPPAPRRCRARRARRQRACMRSRSDSEPTRIPTLGSATRRPPRCRGGSARRRTRRARPPRYAAARASSTVSPVPVTERILPPFVTSRPSRTAVPAVEARALRSRSPPRRPSIGRPA